MKFLFYFALLLAFMCASLHAVEPDCDVPRLLVAIAAKEQHGEGNEYGIRADVWRQQMRGWPYYLAASEPGMARQCAVKHINWLAHELSKAGYAPSAYCIAAAWHLGLAGYVKLAKAGGESQYGREVANLYGAP